ITLCLRRKTERRVSSRMGIQRKPFVSRGSLTAASITSSSPACGMRSTRSRGSSMSSP
ncbi:hypothetical protein ATANTOWER_008293, partial [Ataeniobius toweri]|nr:hypothetical protein [Ataeniobius toweri]